jgi:hypothetical protein
MSRCLPASLLLLSAASPALALPQASSGAPGESCVVCHGKEGHDLARSIHSKAGITCTSCHGGDGGSLEVGQAHGKDLARLAKPREMLESCGGCHSDVQRMRLYGLRTDQLSLYWTSRHGERLTQESDANVATCVSCHGSHLVLGATDPRSPVHRFNQVVTCGRCHSDEGLMGRYGLNSDTVDLYRKSVHGHALLDEGHVAAPACADCHGSHGAAPPRMKEIGQVCGHCHSVVQGYFEDSPHFLALAKGAPVACVACHGNHLVSKPSADLFVGEEKGHCGSCHAEEKDPASATAAQLHAGVVELDRTIRSAEEDVRIAGTKGLFLGPEKGYLDDARGLLVRARALTHRLSAPALADILNRGRAMVQQTRESLETKGRVFRDRRIFTTIFFGVSVAFGIVLVMYGRLIRGRSKSVAGSSAAGAGDVR